MTTTNYTLIVKGTRIPVSEEVYRAYYQEYERERYLKKRKIGRESSYEDLNERGVSVDHHATIRSADPGEMLLVKESHQAIRKAFHSLRKEEQDLLTALILAEEPQRTTATRLGISQSTISKRKQIALKKLQQAYERQDPPDNATAKGAPKKDADESLVDALRKDR